MSAAYDAVTRLLDELDDVDANEVERRPTAYMFDLERGKLRALLALVDEREFATEEVTALRASVDRLADVVDALVEVLAARTVTAEAEAGPDVCGHIAGTQCRECDHAAHHGRACTAPLILASGGVGPCGCAVSETAP